MENKSTLPLIVLMTIGFIGLVVVQSIFFKPKIPDAGNNQNAAQKEDNELATLDEVKNQDADDSTENEEAKKQEPRPDLPREFFVLGSFDAEGHPLVLTLDTQGATVRRLELNTRRKNGKIKYHDVDYREAYIGQMELADVPTGCEVRVMVDGTPADLAGVEIGDVIKSLNGQPVVDVADFEKLLAEIKPGTEISLVVSRAGQDQNMTVATTSMPMQVIRPTDPDLLSDREMKRRAFQLTLKEETPGAWPDLDAEMRSRNWQGKLVQIDGQEAVEFSYDMPVTRTGQKFQVVKRYSLSADAERQYHANMDFEIRNVGDEDTKINYELCGPTGLPQEGWWYQMKIHGGTWAIGKMAGARDITLSSEHRPFQFISGPQVVTDAKESAGTVLIEKGAEAAKRKLNYLGIDTLYFNVALIPKNPDYTCFSAFGVTAAKMDEAKRRRQKLTDVSFVVYSESIDLKAGETHKESFEIFAGPKEPELLEKYEGLENTRTFGWFAMFSKPLIWLLHKLYKLTFSWSYGLAIVLLTIIVRLCMVPISRKAALNQQMMQYLAPQMKELQEKYKEDPKKFFAARSELCARYNYKPLGGCLLMFIQLPIFLGLYRGLSVDVELRNAPLFPGMEWCSNLGGPDKLFEWQSWMPSFLGGETGFLGPYFNLLPILAIVLMFVQQKMFMPPATDDQSAMAQKMMKYMMIFMGFIFFKVAAGLCIYFVTSSIWGIVERKMLPKPELDTSQFDSDGGGSGKSKKPTESLPLRNEQALEERKRMDRERKKKLRKRQ